MDTITLLNGQKGQILQTIGDSVLFLDEKTGKRSWIKKYSIFTNFADSIKDSIHKTNARLIENTEKRIKKHRDIVEKAREAWGAAKEAVKEASTRMCSILKKANVTNYSQLEAAEQEEFLHAKADKYDAKSMMTYESNKELSSLHTIFGLVLDKGKVEMRDALV